MASKRQIRQQTPPNPRDYIQCPLDLDSLIMPQTATPDVVELNCALADDDILYDALRLSTCSYWMFKLDVLGQFSSDFRTRLYGCLPAVSRIVKSYFNYQMDSASTHLKDEYDHFLEEQGLQRFDNLNNPFKMLSNGIKECDLKVLQGQTTPRQMLIDRIQEFIDTKDKDKIDFSYSLFLPEFLNPKFFQELSEAEQVVLVLNLGKYFDFLKKMLNGKPGVFRGFPARKQELFPPKLIVKHIFESDSYSNRVKMLAWGQLYLELEKAGSRNKTFGAATILDDIDAVTTNIDSAFMKLAKVDVTPAQLDKWLVDAEGVFESFELDCTLHNLDATNFFVLIASHPLHHKMTKGMVDFQDDDTRNRMFKVIAKTMTPNM